MLITYGCKPLNLGQRKPSNVDFEANLRRLQRDAQVVAPQSREIPEEYVPGHDYLPGSFANYMAV